MRNKPGETVSHIKVTGCSYRRLKSRGNQRQFSLKKKGGHWVSDPRKKKSGDCD